MVALIALYPQNVDSQFDMDYYINTHTSLVRERLTPMGLTGVDLTVGLAGGAPDSPPAYTMIGQLKFNTIEELQAAVGTHGPELMGDVANFTNVQPIMQISQIL